MSIYLVAGAGVIIGLFASFLFVWLFLIGDPDCQPDQPVSDGPADDDPGIAKFFCDEKLLLGEYDPYSGRPPLSAGLWHQPRANLEQAIAIGFLFEQQVGQMPDIVCELIDYWSEKTARSRGVEMSPFVMSEIKEGARRKLPDLAREMAQIGEVGMIQRYCGALTTTLSQPANSAELDDPYDEDW